ncbi:hypothetical protein PoB_004370000 [Plakobranchus ocellatus]|uniref:Uncharacterized protein n=1 Tax=Plakobranchus ocellatus TaxID=259542 RepID=A0AAV4BCD5_9GAST|nr:hypothetical protein PoB_004370000 [Plakobranchus ocellatus]
MDPTKEKNKALQYPRSDANVKYQDTNQLIKDVPPESTQQHVRQRCPSTHPAQGDPSVYNCQQGAFVSRYPISPVATVAYIRSQLRMSDEPINKSKSLRASSMGPAYNSKTLHNGITQIIDSKALQSEQFRGVKHEHLYDSQPNSKVWQSNTTAFQTLHSSKSKETKLDDQQNIILHKVKWGPIGHNRIAHSNVTNVFPLRNVNGDYEEAIPLITNAGCHLLPEITYSCPGILKHQPPKSLDYPICGHRGQDISSLKCVKISQGSTHPLPTLGHSSNEHTRQDHGDFNGKEPVPSSTITRDSWGDRNLTARKVVPTSMKQGTFAQGNAVSINNYQTCEKKDALDIHKHNLGPLKQDYPLKLSDLQYKPQLEHENKSSRNRQGNTLQQCARMDGDRSDNCPVKTNVSTGSLDAVKTKVSVTSLDSGGTLTTSQLQFATSTPLAEHKNSNRDNLQRNVASSFPPPPHQNACITMLEGHNARPQSKTKDADTLLSSGVDRERNTKAGAFDSTARNSTGSKCLFSDDFQAMTPFRKDQPLFEPPTLLTPIHGEKESPPALPKSAPTWNFQGGRNDNIDAQKDGPTLARVLTRSVPGCKRVSREGGRKALKPINLFPEWTQHPQAPPGGFQNSNEHFRKTSNAYHGAENRIRQVNTDLIRTQGDKTDDRSTLTSSFKDENLLKFATKRGHIEPPKQTNLSITSQQPNVKNSRFEDGAVHNREQSKYWFSENTVRRLSAVEPGMFRNAETKVKERSSCIGVRQAKSVDIAAIYSKLNPVPNSGSGHSNNYRDKYGNNNKDISSNFKFPQVPIRNSHNSIKKLSSLPNPQDILKQNKQNPKPMLCLQPSQSLNVNPTSSHIAITDHGIPDEEFRPAVLFLQDLYNSMEESEKSPTPSLAVSSTEGTQTRKHSHHLRVSTPGNDQAAGQVGGKVPSQHNAIQRKRGEIQRQSLPAFMAMDQNGEKEGGYKMTQDQIRLNMERNRRRDMKKSSLPQQAGIFESEKPFKNKVHYADVKRQQLYNSAREKMKINAQRLSGVKELSLNVTPKVENLQQAVLVGCNEKQYAPEFENSSSGQSKDKTITWAETRAHKENHSNEDFLKSLDAAVTRRHTIDFTNVQMEPAAQAFQAFRYPSTETISSGFRSLERNENWKGHGQHAAKTGQSGQAKQRLCRTPDPPCEKRNANECQEIASTKAELISKTKTLVENKSAEKKLHTHATKLPISPSKTIKNQIPVKDNYHKHPSHELRSKGDTLGISDSARRVRQCHEDSLHQRESKSTNQYNPNTNIVPVSKSFHGSTYRPVPGPSQFLTNGQCVPTDKRMSTAVFRPAQRIVTQSPNPRRQTIGGTDVLGHLEVNIVD